jgi:predicted transcriptional regulator
VSRIDDVARLHAEGLTGKAIAEELGITPPTVCYYLRRPGVPKQPQGRYDWGEVQAYYDEGHSMRDCVERFGFSHSQTDNFAGRNRPLRVFPGAV